MNAYVTAGLAAVLLACAGTSPAADSAKKTHGAEEVKKDIADHRAMAEAHLNAAKCLEAGKTEKACLEQLAKDCKGLGIGKYCGLKHRH